MFDSEAESRTSRYQPVPFQYTHKSEEIAVGYPAPDAAVPTISKKSLDEVMLSFL
jgi:hypothetical protein